jgi:hypothetical protein
MKKIILTCFVACLSISAWAQTNPAPNTDPNAEFDRYFMPGGGYGVYIPKGKDSLGTLSGGVVEFLFFTRVAQNDDSGPSHVRLFGKLNLLNSSKKNVSDFLLYSVGLDMSLERNPKRNYFIPYFGLEMGGISNKNFGTSLQFTPMLGLHLISRQNLFLNVQGGYMYPVKNFDLLQGYMLQAGLNFSFW